MRLRILLAALLSVAMLLTFESSNVFAQRHGGGHGGGGWQGGGGGWHGGGGGWHGGGGGWHGGGWHGGGWGSGWGYGLGGFALGYGLGRLGSGYWGGYYGGSPYYSGYWGGSPYYSGSYYYPSYAYSYPDYSYDSAPSVIYDTTPSTSFYYSPSMDYTTPSAPAQPPQTVTVQLNNQGVAQPQMTIPRGSTVYWSNDSGATQTVTSDNGMWNSGPIPNGYRYNVTFNQPGTYSYHSENNPNVRGTNVVQYHDVGTTGVFSGTPRDPRPGCGRLERLLPDAGASAERSRFAALPGT